MKKNFVKRVLTAGLALCMVASMAACGSKEAANSTDADSGVKPVLLAVSFGTSFNNSRDITIGAVEKALQDANPDYEVRRAFTSQIIIDKLKDRDNIEIDNVKEAMDRLVTDGVKDVVIQPTHVMPGFEYNDVLDEVNTYADKFNSLKIGSALLTTDEDFDTLAGVLNDITADYQADDTAVIFMGHGTEHEANGTYAKLQEKIDDKGIKNMFIGTVEAEPSLDDVIKMAKDAKVKKVVLRPLMIVAGDHANNDMAGDEKDSWKSTFEKEGFEVECVIEGLGQVEGVQQMIVKHAQEAMAK